MMMYECHVLWVDVSDDIINSLLKTGDKTANINVKKLQFIHTVNGDGSKTAKIIKRQC